MENKDNKPTSNVAKNNYFPIFSREYTEKKFLLPNSILSMASYHTKIYNNERQEYQLRIHDCNGGIKLWGTVRNEAEFIDAYRKLDVLEQGIHNLKKEIVSQFLEHNKKKFGTGFSSNEVQELLINAIKQKKDDAS